tara:strand:- start:398 stop:763 length:366 start_codon:yes stop_codon:yes gene_type:complete
MATGLSGYLADSLLDTVASSGVYLQLHVGDPGIAGTSNPAIETTRQAVTFSAASGGVLTSNGAVSWTSIAGTEDATFFSTWNASTSGDFLFSGSISGNSYTAGDTLTIPSGQLGASLTIVS